MRGTSAPLLRIAVGIATSGRAAILGETLADLGRQSLQPEQIFVLYSKEEDIAGLPSRFPSVQFGRADGGLCEKRNRILESATKADLMLFLDDDFFCDTEYLRVTEEAFREDERIVATTGVVLADGAKGPGLAVEAARAALSRASGAKGSSFRSSAFNTYGCNMAFRLRTIREHGMRFDEGLPAYGWYEDIDFSRRLANWGAMVRLGGALGVHLGAKVGRVSGRRLGYSQVANPIYLARKGSYPWSNTARSVARNFLANLVRSLRPEHFVDRRGRLRGNLLAFYDLLRGRMHPDRIHDMH